MNTKSPAVLVAILRSTVTLLPPRTGIHHSYATALSWQSAVPPPPLLQLGEAPFGPPLALLKFWGNLCKLIQPDGASLAPPTDGRQKSPSTRQLNHSAAPWC